jgi:Ca2+-binding EF-hand superfamily protein
MATKPAEAAPVIQQKNEDQPVKSATPEIESSLANTAKSDSKTSGDKKSEDKPRELRVAILTPGGPLIADVTLTIDGHPQHEAFDELVKGVLAAADTDKDKRATWKELSDNKEYLKTQPGGDRPAPPRQLKMWTDEYDRNKDGQIQPDEAASWLGRDAGVKASPFSVRSSRSYFSVPSAASRVWKLVDADDDGHLSAAELQSGSDTLFSLDDNADGVVTSEEVTSLREQLRLDSDQATIVDRAANPFAALYLEPDFDHDRLQYLLNDLYAPRQDLHPSSFPALAKEFELLDENSDGDLDQDELAKLLTTKPHLKLSIDFSRGDTPDKNKATLTIVDHIPAIELIAQPAADRIAVSLGATRLSFSAHDLLLGQDPAQAAVASQLKLMVHDQSDPLVEMLDSNADGRLGEREIATSAQRLMNFDANKNGQIDTNELPYSMVVAFLRGEQPGEQSFYRPQSARLLSTSDARSWFSHADFNGDGDVSRREFLGSSEQFSKLDSNADGFISAGEAKSPSATSAAAESSSELRTE